MSETMKAAVLETAGKVVYKDVPVPEIGDNDFLIKVAYSGVCGSDMPRSQKENGARLYPLIMGHEFSGNIAKMGKNIKGFKVGEPVGIAPLIPDAKAFESQIGWFALSKYNLIGTGSNGGFAQYVKVPEGHVLHLPKEISLREAAGIEPATVGTFGLMRGHIQAGDTVAVLGAGSIGQFAVQAAKLFGASKVIAIDILADKLQLVKKLGADETINGKEEDVVKKLHEMVPNGVDLAIDCAGSKYTEVEALQVARNAGQVVFVGISGTDLPIPADVFEGRILRGALNVHGSWMSYSRPYPGRAWKVVMDGMKKGRMKFASMISNQIELKDLGDTLKKMYNHQLKFNKVLVKVDQSLED